MQISKWFAKVESSRTVAKRPPPSYMYMPVPETSSISTVAEADEVPDLESMAALDSPALAQLC